MPDESVFELFFENGQVAPTVYTAIYIQAPERPDGEDVLYDYNGTRVAALDARSLRIPAPMSFEEAVMAALRNAPPGYTLVSIQHPLMELGVSSDKENLADALDEMIARLGPEDPEEETHPSGPVIDLDRLIS